MANDGEKYYPCCCDNCGWEGSSKELEGDPWDDAYAVCPICHSISIAELFQSDFANDAELDQFIDEIMDDLSL